MRALFLASALLFSAMISQAKTIVPPISRVDPPSWWIGMKEEKLELTFYGPDIQRYEVALDHSPSRITKITHPSNHDYLFVEITIAPDQAAGDLIFSFNEKGAKPSRKKNKSRIEHRFPLLKRNNQSKAAGLTAQDLIYLVFPDRFSNGDPKNDVVAGMNEATSDRKGLKSRHGGDIAGIQNHLDYFTELGVTALWINPVLENNEPAESYHGYAATDLYKVDPRFGTNESYKALVDDCHSKGIKVIWDVVYNHWGDKNWLFLDLPDSNWVHWFGKFTRTSYRAETLMDPYASEYDKKIMSDAWFDKHMPDLNQQDAHLAKYLIQNSIWWIEYAGLDAFRIDTYAYPDQQFMKDLNEAVRKEYPRFFLFGETWVQTTPVQAWFTQDAFVKKTYSSSLNSVTDFQLFYAITKGLKENFGWEEGFRRIELTLAQDGLYKNANDLVTFLDNHDLSRYYSMVDEDFAKYKMGIAMLYTLRGIPSIYYGTEILMKNYADPDAKVREDFPGGWTGDANNKFIAAGRNEKENEAFNFFKSLGQWRKENAWMATSKLTQFVPEDNTYVYFRHDGEHTLMCVYNGNDKEVNIDLSRFSECLKGKTRGKEIVSGLRATFSGALTMAPKSVGVYEVE